MKLRQIPTPFLWGAAILAIAVIPLSAWMVQKAGFINAFLISVDIDVYQGGGRAVLDNLPLYGAAVPGSELPFTYAPFAAVIFVPLAFLPGWSVSVFGVVVNIAATAFVIALVTRVLRYRVERRYWWFVALATIACYLVFPLQQTLWLGQINIVLMALVLADLLRRNSRWCGVGVGLAAGIKLTPLIFIGYLVVTRQWRAAATAFGTFLATLAIGFAVLGRQALDYWTEAIGHTERIGYADLSGNQSINGVINQLLRKADVEQYIRLSPLGTPVYTAPTWMWLAFALVAAGLGFWAAALAYRRGNVLFAITITGLTGCAVSPYSWGHHWVWVLPLLLITIDWAWRTTRDVTAAGQLRWLVPLAVFADTFIYPMIGKDGHMIYGGIAYIPRPQSNHWYDYLLTTIMAGHYSLVFLAAAISAIVIYRRSEQQVMAGASSSSEE